MDDSMQSSKNFHKGLTPVAECEPPQRPGVDSEDAESHSGSVVEKDGVSASASTTSEELMFVDESVPVPTKRKGSENGIPAVSPFGGGRPPRPPVCPGDPEVEGVLPSQPSIVRRMQETNRHDIDPKDARALLPSVLLNSSSLDLDGSGVSEEASAREKQLQEEAALLNLLRQKELEDLMLAQQQRREQEQLLLGLPSVSGLDLEMFPSALSNQCRVSPPGFPQQPAFSQQQPQQQPVDVPSSNLLLQQMMTRPRHGRSLSDPTFAFAGALNPIVPTPNFQPTTSVDTSATTPLMDQADALAFLNVANLQQSLQRQPEWMTPPESTLQPSLGALFSNVSGNLQPEIPKPETTTTAHAQRKRNHRVSKSVDYTTMMKHNQSPSNTSGIASKSKINSGSNRHVPLSPSTGSKSVTRAEVKKLVEDQARLGRPTYAPWFRDRSNRNNSSSGSNMGIVVPTITGKEAETPTEMHPAHHRSQSLPQVNTVMPPKSPKNPKDSDPQQPTPKSGRVGTGVFFPRMPVQN